MNEYCSRLALLFRFSVVHVNHVKLVVPPMKCCSCAFKSPVRGACTLDQLFVSTRPELLSVRLPERQGREGLQ